MHPGVAELCDGCVARRLQEEEEDQFTFEQATIFVRKVVAPLSNAAPDIESAVDEEDPDFMEVREWCPQLALTNLFPFCVPPLSIGVCDCFNFSTTWAATFCLRGYKCMLVIFLFP